MFLRNCNVKLIKHAETDLTVETLILRALLVGSQYVSIHRTLCLLAMYMTMFV